MKILVVRNDKLGDFMLAYPCFKLLKTNIPNIEIHALVTSYTQPMAMLNNSIDKLIVDPGCNNITIKGIVSFLNLLKTEKYDAVITLVSTTRIGLMAWVAGIPYRLAPATKLAQIFYNHKLVQRRSRSEKPEYAYNIDLIYYFLKAHEIDNITEPAAPFLSFPKSEVSALRKKFTQENHIPEKHKLIFIHAGSGGSAVNITPVQYAELANNLSSSSGHTIVLTAGPGEMETARLVAAKLVNTPYILYESKSGIDDFAKHLQFADLFISGSTGPLHIAGALDTPTAGFYPLRRSATPLRWQTLNSPDKRLAFFPDKSAKEEDMSSIDIRKAANIISSFMAKRSTHNYIDY